MWILIILNNTARPMVTFISTLQYPPFMSIVREIEETNKTSYQGFRVDFLNYLAQTLELGKLNIWNLRWYDTFSSILHDFLFFTVPARLYSHSVSEMAVWPNTHRSSIRKAILLVFAQHTQNIGRGHNLFSTVKMLHTLLLFIHYIIAV